MQGILIVDKPQGWTSFDVVAKLRRVLGTRKIGHSGTLDPIATGVLPVFAGQAARAVDMQADHDKTYEATLLLGSRTDTGDITGQVLESSPVTVGEKELLEVLPRFVGPQMQLPPMYSAVKINGQPLYKAARQGKEVERQPRPVEIYSLRFLGQAGENEYRLEIACSKGTYVRVLLEEIGRAIGMPATPSQGPRWPWSCQRRATTPQPLHRSAARSPGRGWEKSARSSPSVPNRCRADT